MRPLQAACGLCLAAALVAPGTPRALAAEDLQPHQAVYRMTMTPGSRSVDVASADGLMVYRAARECGGWAVENRTVIRFGDADGRTFEDKWTFVSWEADDGLAYRFRVLHETGGETERIEGSATLEAKGGAGLAIYTTPEDLTIELPAGTLFPTEHLRRLIAAAQSGSTIFQRVVFDGTTQDNPYLVNVVIAALRDRDEPPLAEAAGAPPAPAYWTRGAFFPHDTDSEVPEFEMSIELRVDGIAERLEQEFEDLGLRGALRSVELLPPPEC